MCFDVVCVWGGREYVNRVVGKGRETNIRTYVQYRETRGRVDKEYVW